MASDDLRALLEKLKGMREQAVQHEQWPDFQPQYDGLCTRIEQCLSEKTQKGARETA